MTKIFYATLTTCTAENCFKLSHLVDFMNQILIALIRYVHHMQFNEIKSEQDFLIV